MKKEIEKKKFDKSKLLKLLLFIFLSVILVYVYFSFVTVVTDDSTYYYGYLNILKGLVPLSNWGSVRGPTMPLVIYGIVKLFGETSVGFSMGTFLFFILGIGIAYLLVYKISNIQSLKSLRIIMWVFFIVLFVFNPFIIGYYHVMLTEFVAATLALVSCFLAIYWVSIDITKEKKRFIIYSGIFIILSVVMWFLKQQYVIVVLIPLLLGIFLSIFKIQKASNTICKIVVFFLCIISVVLSINVWDQVLIHSGSNAASSKGVSEGFLTAGLIHSASNFHEIDKKDSHDVDFIESSKYLNSEEKNLIEDITNKKSIYYDYDLYEVLSIREGALVDIIVIPDFTPDTVSITDVKLFFSVTMKQYPKHVLSSYVANYFSLIDLTYSSYGYGSPFPFPQKQFIQFDGLHGENQSIGLATYFADSTFLVSSAADSSHMQQYIIENPNNLSGQSWGKSICVCALLLLPLTILLSPFCFIILTILYLCKKDLRLKERSLLYESLIILFGYSFLHVIFHVITGAIIDRYSFVAYPTAILGCILLINFIPVNQIKESFSKLLRKKQMED